MLIVFYIVIPAFIVYNTFRHIAKGENSMKISKLTELVKQASNNVEDMIALKNQLDSQGISLENIYQELEMSSSYADSHRDISTTCDRILPHSHSFYELLYCISSDNVQYLLGSQRYTLQKGDVLMIPPGISHCPLFPEVMHGAYERIVVWVNAEMLRQLCLRWPEIQLWQDSAFLRTAGTVWEKPIEDVFLRSCHESEKREAGWEAALYGNTTVLVTMLVRALLSEGTAPSSERNELLDELLRYVEAHLSEKISVNSAARHLLVSESVITHLCSRQLGISFYRYVIQRRLIAAKSLIETGALLSEVATQVGFQDYSSFFRAFKQEFGISPRQYRNL